MSRNNFYDKTIMQLKDMFKNETAWSILDNMQAVYEAKDSDYSATGLPMGNLRKCEDAGIEAWRGCLVRIGDKISRLENFLKEKEYLVLSEKAEDTIIDLANYAILMSCLIEEMKPSHSDFYWNLSDKTQEHLLNLSYCCVLQASLWKENDTENGFVFLQKAMSYWKPLCEYSCEMN